jgi:hypothetical protein
MVRMEKARSRDKGKARAKRTCKDGYRSGLLKRRRKRAMAMLPSASRMSQQPKTRPMDSSFPKKATISSRTMMAWVMVKVKPIRRKARRNFTGKALPQ